MIKKIAFTSYPVTDMERSVDFYGNVLGFNLLFKREDWSEFDIDGQRLTLHKEEIPSGKNPGGRVIVSFEAKPIEKIVESLKVKGVRFKGEVEVYPYGKLAWFLDPDGNILGLYEPA